MQPNNWPGVECGLTWVVHELMHVKLGGVLQMEINWESLNLTIPQPPSVRSSVLIQLWENCTILLPNRRVWVRLVPLCSWVYSLPPTVSVPIGPLAGGLRPGPHTLWNQRDIKQHVSHMGIPLRADTRGERSGERGRLRSQSESCTSRFLEIYWGRN